jgi:hypothetical protein
MSTSFKIRSPQGTFSTGGPKPKFTNTGKTWGSRGHLTNHLLRFKGKNFEKYYKDCQLVAFELNQLDAIPLVEDNLENIRNFRAKFGDSAPSVNPIPTETLVVIEPPVTLDPVTTPAVVVGDTPTPVTVTADGPTEVLTTSSW